MLSLAVRCVSKFDQLSFDTGYRYPVTENISINPGLLAVINPEGNSDRDTIYVGTIRTIFKF